MDQPFTIPADIRYNRRRPGGIAIFALAYFLWKWLTHPQLGEWSAIVDPFVWVVPVVLGFAVVKMWSRVVIRFEAQDIYIYPLFGPGQRRYRYAGFESLAVIRGRLYVLKEDPDTGGQRGVFLIAGWAMDPQHWIRLADHLKQLNAGRQVDVDID